MNVEEECVRGRIELTDGTIKRELVFLGAVQLGKLRRDVENLKIEVSQNI